VKPQQKKVKKTAGGARRPVIRSDAQVMPRVDSQRSPRYSADRPNKPPQLDLLGRDSFAARLADDIRGWQGQDSLVIGLYGSWGCGKTSLKERVLSHLRDRDPDYPILDFNPWQLSGSGNLVLT
jgi:hypothetical protein